MNKEERLMMSEEEVRQRVKELLNLPKEDLLTQYLFLQQENQELKKQLEEYRRLGFKHLNDKCNKLENQQKEFIEYLENEKDRLASSGSYTYEDSLGKTRLVNEDIFDEIDKILSKYQEITGGKE